MGVPPMYLPGTIYDRIGDLRTSRGWSQKKLSEITGIVTSQLSRIENGNIENISSDILIKLANAFGVSSDYILGLTTVSVRKSYDIGELGLSEGTVRGLATGAIDVQVLNRLMEHKTFPYLLYLIKTYFDNNIADGIMERNAIIDMATAALGDFVKDNPEHKKEAQADAKLLRSQKLADHEAEIEKIKTALVGKDIPFEEAEGLGYEVVSFKVTDVSHGSVSANLEVKLTNPKEAVIMRYADVLSVKLQEIDKAGNELKNREFNVNLSGKTEGATGNYEYYAISFYPKDAEKYVDFAKVRFLPAK